MSTIPIRDSNNKRRPGGKFTMSIKDVVMMRTQLGENTSIAYEDLLAQLSGAISGGGVGVGSDGEIDLGDRMTGNDIMDLGNRV
jgi:hypothetical protein